MKEVFSIHDIPGEDICSVYTLAYVSLHPSRPVGLVADVRL